MPQTALGSLDLHSLAARYRKGETTARDVLAGIHARILTDDDPAVFTLLLSAGEVDQQIALAETRQRQGIPQPLFGVPFAIKDNHELTGEVTTHGTGAYDRTPATQDAVPQPCFSR